MLVDTLEALTSVRAKLKNAYRSGEAVGFDTEFDAPQIEYRGKRRPDVLRAELVGFSLAFKGERRGYYIPMCLASQKSPEQVEWDQRTRKLLKFVEVEGFRVWAHNWKAELHALRNSGYSVNCYMLDSELCAWMAGWKLPGKGGLKLKALAEAKLGYHGPTFEDVAQGRQASQVPAAEMAPYAARDAVLAMALGELAWERLEELDCLDHYDIERRCLPVTAEMERTGVPLDRARLLEDAERCEAEMAEVSRRFHNITLTRLPIPTKVKEQKECEFCGGDADFESGLTSLCDGRNGCVSGKLFFKNGRPRMHTVVRDVPTLAGADVGNDRQVARWLFDELRWWPTKEYEQGKECSGCDGHGCIHCDNRGCDKPRLVYEHPRNEVGWSVAEEDIRRFTTLPGLPGEAARLRLRFQALRKYASTYTRGLVDLAHQSGDGRLHCGFKQDGTSTSRYSSSGPNLQNLPSSERQDLPWLKDLPDIRASFCAAPGWKIVERDVNQGELRLLGHFSEDPNLLHVYRTGGDIHALTMQALGVERRPAKIGNFATSYLISGKSLAVKVRMGTNDWSYSDQQAQEFIDGWYGTYVGVRPWQDEVIADAERNRYATTITGFKEPLTEWRGFKRYGSERKAVNTPIQGSLAGLLKMAMAALYERWKREGELGVRVRFVAQVHDSIVLEAREDFADEANRVMGACLLWVGRKYGLRVPLESSGGVGNNWSEVH